MKTETYIREMLSKHAKTNLKIRKSAILELSNRMDDLFESLVPDICERVQKENRTTIMEEDIVYTLSKLYHL